MSVMDQCDAIQAEINTLLQNGRTANMLNAEELEKLSDLIQRQFELFKMGLDKNP